MRKIKEIYIHCSDSRTGSAVIIDKWHKDRIPPFDCIGYHAVINNGPYNDGHIELGRPLHIQGAHAYPHNKNSIGICLIGKDKFTPKQMASLTSLCIQLMKEFDINVENVIGHYEVNKHKTCPNIDMRLFRGYLGIVYR